MNIPVWLFCLLVIPAGFVYLIITFGMIALIVEIVSAIISLTKEHINEKKNH